MRMGFSKGTSLATGFSWRVIVISAPRLTCSRSSENRVFASKAPIVEVSINQLVSDQFIAYSGSGNPFRRLIGRTEKLDRRNQWKRRREFLIFVLFVSFCGMSATIFPKMARVRQDFPGSVTLDVC